MLANFKKFGVAAAVAAAIGASGAAQAITLGEPGGALLVPYVIFSSTQHLNTLIGITVGDSVPAGDFPTVVGEGDGCADVYRPNNPDRLHWYFFDVKSNHKANGRVPVTCNDFSRFDWGYVVAGGSTTSANLDNVPGYLVVSSDDSRDGDSPSRYALYGSAYLVQGNWASEAFIPVLPLLDDTDANPADEVRYSGGFPSYVNPLLSGMPLANVSGQSARFSLRYTLPVPGQGVNANTALVFWFPDNSGDIYVSGGTTVGTIDRRNLGIDVYDADEDFRSASISLPDELNVVNASTINSTINNPSLWIPDMAGTQPAVNSGFVLFSIADYTTVSAIAAPSRAGVAFSLIQIEGGASPDQVQTDLAHERGLIIPRTGG